MILHEQGSVGIVDKWEPLKGTIDAINKSVMDHIMLIAGLVDVETKMFFTSTHWGEIARAIQAAHPEVKFNPQNFKRLFILKLELINSGSEDQDAVNLANRAFAERGHFAYNREHKRSG